MSEVTARLGKVHVPTDEDGETEEYTPEAARRLAVGLLRAVGEAERQAAAITAACAGGHDWDDGANWGEGDHAHTSWRCRREGCDGYRTEPGHHIDDTEGIARLLEQLPPDDQLGRILLDFDGHPVVTMMGIRLSREDRIDGAAMRAHFAPLLRKAANEIDRTMLGEAFIPPPAKSVEPGPFGIPVHVYPGAPESSLIAIGNCWCRHSVADHGPTGCTVALAPDTQCPCDRPITKLAVVIKTEP